MVCHPNLPNQRKFTTQNAAQRAKGSFYNNLLMAKPERGGGKKRTETNWSFIFKQSVWIKWENIAQPEFDFQAWLVFWLFFFSACLGFVVVGVFTVGFVLWLLFLTVFNLSDPGLRKTKNPPHVLKGFGYFICSSFSILLLSLDEYWNSSLHPL